MIFLNLKAVDIYVYVAEKYFKLHIGYFFIVSIFFQCALCISMYFYNEVYIYIYIYVFQIIIPLEILDNIVLIMRIVFLKTLTCQ